MTPRRLQLLRPWRNAALVTVCGIIVLWTGGAGAAFLKPSTHFDSTLEVLPAHFDGHNVLAMISQSKKIDEMKKDQYEKTETFTARKDRKIQDVFGVAKEGAIAIIVRNSPFTAVTKSGSISFSVGKNAA